VLHGYRELGVRRVVLGAGRDRWHEPASTMPFLDRYAAVIPDLAS
jgi:hypothetical protein